MNLKLKIRVLLSVSCLIWVSCSNMESNSELEDFNSFLGPQKSEGLDALTESFGKFLNLNFPDGTMAEQTGHFLEFIHSSSLLSDSTWKIDDQGKSVLDKVEKSGLRKEVFLFGYETYVVHYDIGELLDKLLPVDTSNLEKLDRIGLDRQNLELWIEEVEIPDVNRTDTTWQEKNADSLWTYNIHGQFLYGLLKCSSDTNVWNYCNARYASGDLNPHLVAAGLLAGNRSFDDPIYQRIISIDIYFHTLKGQVEKYQLLNK